ncbi:trypsin-like peptidase domain-containing protein [Pseudonocardia alni]|uniref:trypsin-like peptidase domain-containing protein n=1 Tax=Pseudonocardia alni TaxID=33907 RepID=UPI00280B74BA|nr:trypsin-like peptidase domain-containing protein [Pseudonocardia alni]
MAVPLLLTAGAAPALAAPAPPPTPEDLNARIEPAIVLLEIAWSGYVLYDTADGQRWSDPLTTSVSCTGFFVSTTGHLATAGHCVDPDEGRSLLIGHLLDQQVEQRLLTSAQASSISPDAQQYWKVEGRNTGSAIVRTITAVQPRAVPGSTLTDPQPAQMLAFEPAAEGDLGLLKIETQNSVALPVASADPRSGAPLTSIGFPGTVRAVSDVNRTRASFISGTVASNQVTPEGVATTEINATINPGMSGGPTVDEIGNVLGVNSFYVRDNNGIQASNFVTDTTSLHDWLGAHGVTTLPPAAAPVEDDASVVTLPVPTVYAVGGAVLLAAVAATVLMTTLRRRRARATSAEAIPAQRNGPHGSVAPQAAAPPVAVTGSAPAAAPVDAGPTVAQEPISDTTEATPEPPSSAPTGPAGSAVSTLTRPAPSRCGSCGSPIGPDARFCSSCGTAAG